MSEEIDITKLFYDHVSMSIDEKGVYPHIMMVEDGSSTLHIHALMLEHPFQVFSAVAKQILDNPKKLIYGLDRFCKDGQGTTLGDCVAGAYWDGSVWKSFIIEYQHEPRIVQPMEWENKSWNDMVMTELRHMDALE
jgi:hypothetical protein